MKKLIALLCLAGMACLAQPYTQTQVDNMMDRSLNPFRQDVVGTNTITIAVAGTNEYRFAVDGEGRNVVKAPTYMTNRWDTVNNKMSASSEYDHPTYVGDLGMIFDPTTASEGVLTIRVYIDDATPKLIRTYRTEYKGPDAEELNMLTTWYWGDETGYDAKNDGIYFTVSADDTGVITSPSVVIYNTQ